MHASFSGTSWLRTCLRFLLAVLAVLGTGAVLQRCTKEKSFEGGSTSSPPIDLPPGEEVKSEWRFRDENNGYAGPVDTAYLTKEGIYTILTLSGKSAGGNQFINIKIKTTDATILGGKTYQTSANEISFLYRNVGDTLYRALPLRGGDVAVKVMDVSATKIIATFKGLVLDKSDRSYFLTEGYFSSPIKKGPQSNNGYLMLWARTSCNGPIQVKANNIAGEISQFYYGAPDCGDPGSAVYNLPPGTYRWVAYCGTDSLEGQANVQPGSCTKVFIDFPFIPSRGTTTELLKTCRLREIQYSGKLESDPRAQWNSVIAAYDNATIDTIQYYSAPAPRSIDHRVSYAGDTVFVDEQNMMRQYFLLDAKKRVVEYRGLLNPTILYPLDQTLVKYTYNDQDELVKREVFDPQYLYLKLETVYTWQNGNIIATAQRNPFNGGHVSVTEFEYYNKEVRAFPFVDFSAFEMVFFQPLCSFGRTCKNPLRKKTFHGINSDAVYYYDSYIIDANHYVLSCRAKDEFGQKNTDFIFRYHCY